MIIRLTTTQTFDMVRVYARTARRCLDMACKASAYDAQAEYLRLAREHLQYAEDCLKRALRLHGAA